MEKVESFMHARGCTLIWIPYLPTFLPIELFWQHGKRYVSFNYHTKRNMVEVWEQVRKGWYGDLTWERQDRVGTADCGKLVGHAIKEMDTWVENDAVLSGYMGALKAPLSYQDNAPGYKNNGVETQEALELAGEFSEFMGNSGDDDELIE